jgi:hypothetical protein
MREIINKTKRPIRIPLPGGKKLFLGPGKEAQISDKAAGTPAVLRLVEEGSIEIMSEGDRADGNTGVASTAEVSQGRAKSPFRRRSGER